MAEEGKRGDVTLNSVLHELADCLGLDDGADGKALLSRMMEMRRSLGQTKTLQAAQLSITAPASIADLALVARTALAEALETDAGNISILLSCPRTAGTLFNTSDASDQLAYQHALDEAIAETQDIEEAVRDEDDMDDLDVVPVDESKDVIGQSPAGPAPLLKSLSGKASRLRVSLGDGVNDRTHSSPALKGGLKKRNSRTGASPLGSPGAKTGVRIGGANTPTPTSVGSIPKRRTGGMAAGGTAGLMGMTFSPSTAAQASASPAHPSLAIGASPGTSMYTGTVPTPQHTPTSQGQAGPAAQQAAQGAGLGAPQAGGAGEKITPDPSPQGSFAGTASHASLHQGASMASAVSAKSGAGLSDPTGLQIDGQAGLDLPSSFPEGSVVSLQALGLQAMTADTWSPVLSRGVRVRPWAPSVAPATASKDDVTAGMTGIDTSSSRPFGLRGSMSSILSAVTEESGQEEQDHKHDDTGSGGGSSGARPSTSVSRASGFRPTDGSDAAKQQRNGANAEPADVDPATLPLCTVVSVAIPQVPTRMDEDSSSAGAIVVTLPAGTAVPECDLATLSALAAFVGAGRLHVEHMMRSTQTRMRSLGLVQMIQAVSHEVTVPAIITRIVSVAYDLLGADRVSVFLVDKERDVLLLLVSEDAAGLKLPMGKGIVGYCAQTGTVVNIQDAYTSPLFDRSFDLQTGYRTRSVLAFPVRDMENGVAAVIQAINKQVPSSTGGPPTVGSFTPGDVRMLSLVADTAGVTLHKAKALQDALLAREANAALVDVVKLSSELDSYEDLEALTNALTEIAHRLVDAERITLYLVDDVKRELFANSAWSGGGAGAAMPVDNSDSGTIMPGGAGGLIRVPFGVGIPGAVAVSGQTIILTNAHSDPRFDKAQDERDGFTTRNVLCMPVCIKPQGAAKRGAGGKVVAVIYAANKRGYVGFTTSDEDLLSAFSTEVATTIDKRSLQLALSKAVADEADEGGQDGAGGIGGGGAGKISSLLGQYVRHPTTQPGQMLRAAPSARRLSGASMGSSVHSLPDRSSSPHRSKSRRGSNAGMPPAHGHGHSGSGGRGLADRSVSVDSSDITLGKLTTSPQQQPVKTPVAGSGPPALSVSSPALSSPGSGMKAVKSEARMTEGQHGHGQQAGSGGQGGSAKDIAGAAANTVRPRLDAGTSASAHSGSGKAVVAGAGVALGLGRDGGVGAGEGDAYYLLDLAPWQASVPRSGRADAAHRAPRRWDWDILHTDDLDLCASMLDMLHTFDLFGQLRLDIGTLASFVDSVRVAYRPNPYHNFKHGVSVAHVCFLGLYHAPIVSLSLAPIERLALLLSALCHDVDHPGVNNAFESNALTSLAIQYNDVSVLENHHAAVMFDLLQSGERGSRPVRARDRDRDVPTSLSSPTAGAPQSEETMSILQLPRAAFATFRRTAIAGILATDMTHHQDLTEQARKRVVPSASSTDGPSTEPLPAKLMVELLVHSADLSNPVLPEFEAVQHWADLVCQEFSAQVASEKALGLPFAPHMDGLTTPAAVAKLQVGFIDYVVAPLWNNIALLLPEFSCAADNLKANRAKWKEILDTHAPPPAPQPAPAVSSPAAAAPGPAPSSSPVPPAAKS